ncbi:MAG TPA: metalloregulator ArsR/SmtB family transcription factor [Solirubrobacterales bacterium]|nr:metalloregulator ArsR/SmtB family transcription factor [Solirubrobacterales bacterium]
MSLPTPIPDPLVELIADRFRLLGEPMRVRALDHLREAGEASVGELAEALDSSQQNLSKHLSALHAGGILSRRRDGNRVLYSIGDQSVIAICEAVCGGIERRAGELSEILDGVAT